MYEYRTKKDNAEQAKIIANNAKNEQRALSLQEQLKISSLTGITGLANLATGEIASKSIDNLIEQIDNNLNEVKQAIGED